MTTDIDPRIIDFDYDLPPEQIANRPHVNRDGGKLLVLQEANITDRKIVDLPSILRKGDLLVVNNTKVFKARLQSRRKTGGKVELFLLSPPIEGQHEYLALAKPSRRLKEAEVLEVYGETGETYQVQLLQKQPEGQWLIALPNAEEVVQKVGQMPIPPYFHRQADKQDEERYQTVFAGPTGAVAAPTAGLHLTTEVIAQLNQMGVSIATITLHVGIGTFKPLTANHLNEGVLHPEHFFLPEETVAAIRQTKKNNGRVIAVGTTTTRCLETVALKNEKICQQTGITRLFIRNNFQFRVIDGLLTNFHLPRSSLLMLVCAFGGKDHVLSAYHHAVKHKYRFFSYGDAMLLIK